MTACLTVLNDAKGMKGERSFSPSSCNPDKQCGNGLEKIYPTCAVRYGYMNYIGEFRYAPGMLFGCGAKVVIQTMRGIEIGQQVSLTCTGCDKSIKRETILDYVQNSGPEFFRLKSGRIHRLATAQDLDEERHINDAAGEKLVRARAVAREVGLSIKFVACEHLFGGERVIFHFMSEDRIDFRELVRVLAQEYHTRIEMHQVGARDEARLVADYEICGRECCCKNFLKTLRPVTMRMAKVQKATLDPSKVSGRCGRLRCCLRYEHEGYEEMDKRLPRVGRRVKTDRGLGTVSDRQILTQLVTVAYDQTGEFETVGYEDLVEVEGVIVNPDRVRPEPPAPVMPPEQHRREPDSRPQRNEQRGQPERRNDQNQNQQPRRGGGPPAPEQPRPNTPEGQDQSREPGGRRRRRRRRGGRGRGDGASGQGPGAPGGPSQ
jgi:cell fate regulator YaaT (PSP1 superfamily)